MSSLKDYARKMFELMPQGVGRAEAITSLTTTTVVCSSLAFGGVTGQKFVDKWLLRRDTTTAADRIRRCTDFTSSSGTLTHAGTNYADTTATSETLEILNYEPYLVDLAIQRSVTRLKRHDSHIIPTRQGITRYDLSGMDWLTDPGDLTGVYYRPSPVITNNRRMERWNNYDSAGSLIPDDWTLVGADATIARSTTNQRHGYNVAITRAGSGTTFQQVPSLLDTGVADDSLAGKTVTAVAWVWSDTASQVSVRVNDGVATTTSAYHTGGSGWEELSVEKTLSDSSVLLSMWVSVEIDGTVYVDEAYLCIGELTDTVRRDAYQTQKLAANEYQLLQDEGLIELPAKGRGGQYIIKTKRSYPQFVASRIAAGTADGDTSDAPETAVAAGALGRLFESLYEDETNEAAKARYLVQANTWNRRSEQLNLKHLEEKSERGFGLDLPPVMAMPGMRRV